MRQLLRKDVKRCLCSSPWHVGSPAKDGASVPMDVSVETSEQFQVDPMETGPSENTEIPQPPTSPGPAAPDKRFYKSRSVLFISTDKNFWGWDRIILIVSCSAARLRVFQC